MTEVGASGTLAARVSTRTGARGGQLALLSLALFSSNYARTALNPLQEQIHHALLLTDSQIAVLQGPVLVVPLVVAAVPMGLLADKVSRARLVWAAVAVAWVGGLLCAFARTYAELLGLRALVGLATGTISIGVLSLVADHFNQEVRGRANMVVTLAEVGGASAAFAAGGLSSGILSRAGDSSWSHTLLCMTIPIGLIALVMGLLRDASSIATHERSSASPVRIGELWRLRRILLPLVAAKVVAVTAYISIVTWAAPALQRTFSVGPGRAAAVLSATLICAGIGGPLAGGLLADLAQRSGGPCGTLKLLILLAIGAVPASLFAALPSIVAATVLLIVFASLVSMISVIEMTLTTILIPNRVRGLALSVLVAVGLLVGAGGAPLIVSELSILLGGTYSLSSALSITCASSAALGAVSLAIGRRLLVRSVDAWSATRANP